MHKVFPVGVTRLGTGAVPESTEIFGQAESKINVLSDTSGKHLETTFGLLEETLRILEGLRQIWSEFIQQKFFHTTC